MPDAITPGWLPALTAFGGYLASSISEWIRDRRTSKRELATAEATVAREREARGAARWAQILEKRAVFQRETLLNLQDAIVKLTRTAGRMNFIDEMKFRETERWGGFLFPESLSDDASSANVTIMVLMSRVRDARIREMTKAFREQASRVGILLDQQAEKLALLKMADILEPLHERIGEVLRQLDDDEDTTSENKPWAKYYNIKDVML